MSWEDLPQYTVHTVQGGSCLHCGLVLPHDGVITYRPAFANNPAVLYLGELLPARRCGQEGNA